MSLGVRISIAGAIVPREALWESQAVYDDVRLLHWAGPAAAIQDVGVGCTAASTNLTGVQMW